MLDVLKEEEAVRHERVSPSEGALGASAKLFVSTAFRGPQGFWHRSDLLGLTSLSPI